MVERIDDTFSRLDRIPACDRPTDRRTARQTDGQTSCHDIVRDMHMRRAVKILEHLKHNDILHHEQQGCVKDQSSRVCKRLSLCYLP